ncbi:MAG: orotidine-5'-phosphate decarboxylase [Verrucomicrobia bacterium]|nr:orotidine-5'-phosphate decarboxylase [Verrucomicrobiota bacterium]
MQAKEKIIVALDVNRIETARNLVAGLQGHVSWYKIGLQLFTLAGPALVKEVKQSGAKVFLDLKFHDIPNTVQHAVDSACSLGADMLTVHLAGGSEMCRAAVIGRASASTLLLGVTVLTSQTELTLFEIGVERTITQQVIALAEVAKEAGVAGLVASPKELQPLKERFGNRFTIVTPGVRPSWSESGDQKRVMTPREAVQLGADYLVIGRPITGAPDPQAALTRIVTEMSVSERNHRDL